MIFFAQSNGVQGRNCSRSLTELKTLEQEVLEISTREQRRIGQDLHDSVGQELTGISYVASSLCKKLTAKSMPEARDARTIVESVRKALDEVHF